MMTRDELKYIRERFQTARVKVNRFSVKALPDTPAVKAARKVIATHVKKQRAHTANHVAKVEKASRVVEEVIFLGDAVRALNAVKAFEKITF